jgi:transposase
MSQHQDLQPSSAQRDELEQLIRRGQASARTQTRARILLLSDRRPGEWRSAPQVAEAVMVHPNTVRNVRRRFAAEGLTAALYDKPRPGATPKLTGEVEAQLTLLACSEAPAGHAHWGLRLLADRLVELGYVESVSPSTVGEWLKKTHSNRGG